jgi:quinoprotein glucose dehydrogenase
LFPFRLKRVPASTLSGEETWPYQPDPELPESFSRQVFRKDDITNLTPEAHAFVSNQLKKAKYGWFQPFAENIPTVLYGILGGGEWMGGSFDPATGWLYVSANNLPWIITVIQRPDEAAEEAALPTAIRPGQQVFLQNCARCHGDHREGRGMAPPLRALNSRFNQDEVASIVQNGRNSMPPVSLSAEQLQQVLSFLFYQYPSSISNPKSGDLSYTFDGYNELLDDRNYPGTKPPWGTLNAINLNTGRIVWKVPLGEYPELKAAGIAKTGTVNFGGASVTAGGLVFCAGTQDHLIRAFNKKDGSELWSYKLPYGGYAPPAIYAAGGEEYIVIAATSGGKLGGKRGDTYVAFALPKQD